MWEDATVVFTLNVGDERTRKRELKRYERATRKYLESLKIPNMRQLLSDYAPLSSNLSQVRKTQAEGARQGQARIVREVGPGSW